MNILIVEPSKIFRLLLETIFREYATNIFISKTGAEAIRTYQKVHIDLICLSFYLSDMDGVEFVSAIRKLTFGETIPILMITSKKLQEATVRSLSDGVTELFQKNNLDELKKYMKLFAEYARQQAQLEGSILLIDSDPQQAGEISAFFKDTRLKFIHFTNAEEAAALARAANFDLVITNVVLGGVMSGMALIREIREINDTMYRVPILAISAISNVSQKIELFRAGANDYIQKPIILEELRVRLKNLLLSKKLFDTVERQKIQLEKMAVHDQLTGLFNRYYLLNYAVKLIDDSYRHKYPLSMLVIDLDHFKAVNDTHGHSMGDTVLKAVADLLLKRFRGNDIPIRFGGEEFMVFLPYCDGQDAVALAESVRMQIRDLRPASISISASIGVTETSPTLQVGYDELFAAADKAVYAAKSQGRNCVVFYQV